MECTQRLECTQELYSTQSERKSPEQIGFLGICGEKYPVNNGPNKIGRDPQTCSIILNLNSISRQHAVINVLNQKEFMLMDLDSANKTKLVGKTLQPFIPHPLKDGDMVQFGDVFGVFRLLEEDNELPMTQAIDIPDTPVYPRHMSRINNPVTTIPESPDVSDRDDSFIIPSQPKGNNKFKSPSNKFIKQSSKTISIQPIGSNKIDNVFWNSSKKSVSLHLDDSSSSLNDSVRSEETLKNQNNASDIHEMETQPPVFNESTDSIYTAATQVPEGCDMSIHNLDTQLPTNEHLPLVCKINNQQEMQFDLYAANKENDVSIFNAETQYVQGEQDHNLLIKTKIKENDCNIFNAETQMVTVDKKDDVANQSINKDSIFNADTQLVTADNDKNVSNKSSNNSKDKINKSIVSDDEILFDEVDSQPILDDFYSQPLLPQEISPNKSADDEDIETLELSQRVVEDHQNDVNPMKRNARLKSDSSTDCEEFDKLPIQKVPAKPKGADTLEKLVEGQQNMDVKPVKRAVRIESDSSTDCEEFDMLPTQKIPEKSKDDGDLTDCEEDKNESLVSGTRNYKPKFHYIKPKENPNVSFEEMSTQVIPENVVDNKSCNQSSVNSGSKSVKDTSFEDLPTQVIPDERDVDFEDLPTQVLDEDVPNPNLVEQEPSQQAYSEEIIFPFKIPMQTPKKFKKKDLTVTPDTKSLKQKSPAVETPLNNTDDKFYAATQELFDDLCSQNEFSPEIVGIPSKKHKESEGQLSSKQDESAKSENELLPKNKVSGNLSESDGEEYVNKYVTSLSSKQVRKVIGVDSPVETIKRVHSDPSDLEVTPKKVRPFKLMSIELPDSQEIKTNVTTNSKSVTESSSDSEVENDSQDNTPILFRNRRRNKAVDAKKDLTKNFDAKTLPSRVITRVRKPTLKIQESDNGTKKMSNNILKSKLFPEQESDINNDILTENISRLKTKIEKKTHKENSVNHAKPDEVKKESETSKKIKEVEIIDLLDSPKKASPNEKSNVTKNKSAEKKTISKSESKTSHTKSTEETNKSSKPESKDSRNKSSKTESKDSNNKSSKAENKESNTKSSKPESEESNNKFSKPERKESNNKSSKLESKDSKKSSKPENKDSKNKSSKPDTKSKRLKDSKSKKESKTTSTETSKTSESKASTSLKENESTVSETLNTRTRRSRNKQKEDSKETEKKSVSPERVKRKRGRPKLTDDENELTSEVRRSARQKVANNKKYNESDVSKSHEQSTVYNLSSESNVDTPKSLKRSAMSDIEVPSPKRTRSALGSSFRATPARAQLTHHVLFTAFPSDEVKVKLETLGAVIVNDVTSCTVVLTRQIKRTFKLLCAVGLGRPIVGPEWVQACVDTNMIVDPWLYLVKDEANEKRFQFNLARTLNGKRHFLHGYNVSCTPRVQPSPNEMKLIVECSGGKWQDKPPRWICVSCAADCALWPILKLRGATIVSSEFILGGVLRQKINIAGTSLC